MGKPGFKTYLTSNVDIDERFIDQLVSQCRVKQVKKDSFLLRFGEKCKQFFFVEKGLLRQYSIDSKGKEHTIQFAPENWFISDRSSLYFNQPSQYFIQAMEDTQVVLLDDGFINQLGQQNKSFLEFNNRLLNNHIRHLQKRINLLLGATAEERYLDFIKTYPDLMLRVPQLYVASYLGITPESLSRVRKDLAHKNFKP